MKPFAIAPLALLAAALAGGSAHAATYHYTDHWDYVAKPASARRSSTTGSRPTPQPATP
jgi:hypothetical protein